MAPAVVCLLEAIEVERDEGEPAAVAPRPGRFDLEAGVEGLVVEEAGERVAPRAVGELSGNPGDISRDAAVERLAGFGLAVAIEHAAEDEQLCGDLARSEPERLALAGEVFYQDRGVVVPSEDGDERREAAELA